MYKSQEDAKRSCASKGGRLFEPRNQQENKAVADAGQEIYRGYWWIGVENKIRDGKFKWAISKQNIDFSNWWPGDDKISEQPDNWKGNEDCVTLKTNSKFDYWYGKWYDWACSLTSRFICEFTKRRQNSKIICIF